MTQLTLETVKLATDTLKTQGLKPTNRKIVDYLGYGSFSTLKKIRESHPELFTSTDMIVSKISTPQRDTLLEQRVSSLEKSLQSIQQMLQTLRQNSDLQQQVQELTENLHEMYQLWQELTQQLSSKSNPPPPKETKETTVMVEEPPSKELPNPQQVKKFVSWVEQQKKRHHGALKPIVEWLNQHQIPMIKGQCWTTESLSNFLRKKRQQLNQTRLKEKREFKG